MLVFWGTTLSAGCISLSHNFSLFPEGKYNYLPVTVNVCAELIKLLVCSTVAIHLLCSGEQVELKMHPFFVSHQRKGTRAKRAARVAKPFSLQVESHGKKYCVSVNLVCLEH